MNKVELCAPAGNYKSLLAAIEHGADAVYLSLSGDTNLRNFPGLNFTSTELESALKHAHDCRKKVFVAVNSFPQGRELQSCYRAIDTAVNLGADAVIISDFALMQYIAEKYPDMRIHVSVQAHTANHEAISFLENRFDIKRVVLPRVLDIKEIRQLRKKTTVELEVFGAGLLCINCEGLCYLSSFLTGESINTYGACSPPKFVEFDYEQGDTAVQSMTVKSNDVVLSRYKNDEKSAYPTPCKGLYECGGELEKVFQESESLNTIGILPELICSGVNALKLEGRQRSVAYVRQVTSAFREAIDLYYQNKPPGEDKISSLFEGMAPTFGSYKNKEKPTCS